MEVMRVPPYPLTTVWNLPIANYTYVQYIEDLVDHSVVEEEVTSDANGIVEYILPLEKVQFDRKFLIRFYDTNHVHVLYEDNLDVIRPYTDPSKLGTTASEIAEYKMFELIARSLIDTYVNDGFYNRKEIVQTIGNGTDYFSLWHDANRVLQAYENNTLVYDVENPDNNVYNYIITLDNSAIQRVVNEQLNRAESAPPDYIPAYGDLGNVGTNKTVDFPKGYDYTFILDTGFKTIPTDVEYATKVLIEDLKCGKLDYYKRYVTGYNTDQFRIQFDKSVLDGTGNMLVDKILDKYTTTIVKPGIL
jgi:hypothetical protein